MNDIAYKNPQKMTPQATEVASIILRDGGITHLRAQHYNIGCVRKAISRIREAGPIGFAVKRENRKDAFGKKYTHWTLAKEQELV